MSKSTLDLILIRGLIASLPEAERAKVEVASKALHAVVAEHGESGAIALALVGTEVVNAVDAG